MSKKQTKMRVVMNNQVTNEELLAMIEAGEGLGVELMQILSQHGCSHRALAVETYALAMVYASLKAVAHSEGFHAELVFESLVPTFKREMEEYVRAAERVIHNS